MIKPNCLQLYTNINKVFIFNIQLHNNNNLNNNLIINILLNIQIYI